MQPKPVTRQILIISDRHLSAETTNLLNATPLNDWPVSGSRTLYGFSIYAHDDELDGLPADLAAICELAATLGADYIELDCEADAISDLPVFDHADVVGPDTSVRPPSAYTHDQVTALVVAARYASWVFSKACGVDFSKASTLIDQTLSPFVADGPPGAPGKNWHHRGPKLERLIGRFRFIFESPLFNDVRHFAKDALTEANRLVPK